MLLHLLFLSGVALADQWCDIVDLKSGIVMTTYGGDCNQSKFGGAWGDSLQTKHVVNTTKKATDDATAAAQATAQATRLARIARIKAACAGMSTATLQDICNQVTDGQ